MSNANANTKTIHRRYPAQEWDYKAISARVKINGSTKDVVYYTLKNKGKSSEGVEVYSGENYILGSKEKSYSRNYPMNKIPSAYKAIVEALKEVHNKKKWSKDPYVNQN